ncbi:VCBS repeat-containing protein [Plantactinospora sp. ZYX-F-223]|uniref:FG-GAP repeat domain-containing protein n=1 Tax=Plantactinospora sp. ZYX-F-223 TaxID=3144103 RepID=UPI0031FBE0E0
MLTTADIQLNEIGTADFNGDGLTDVFWWSNQGEGFGTFLNTAAGQFVPGPVKQDEGEINDYQLADFDGNGATDAVIAFHTAPGTPGNGVVMAFDDGTKEWLRHSRVSETASGTPASVRRRRQLLWDGSLHLQRNRYAVSRSASCFG